MSWLAGKRWRRGTTTSKNWPKRAASVSLSPSAPTRAIRPATCPAPASPPQGFSQWPDPLGLGATRDAELVERFGDIARQEYLAVGIRTALHPMADLATEPRWARMSGTFGEDAELSSRLTAAYIRGFQKGRRGHRPRKRLLYRQTFSRRRAAKGWLGPPLFLRPRPGLPRRKL